MHTLLAQLAEKPATQAIGLSIKAGDVAAALRGIERLVQRIYCEPLNTALIFADPLLDATCQWLGYESLQANSVAFALAGNAPAAQPGQVVCVVSRLQRAGGHTAVLAEILSSPDFKNLPVTVLLTGVGGATAADALTLRFGHLPQVRFERAPRFSRLRKLGWLQQRLHQLQPTDVWLVNHHHDSVAVAAVQPDQGYSLHYLHHGDHHLCLGVYLGYGAHIDLHPMGFRNCRCVLGIAHNSYLPLTAPDRGVRTSATPHAAAHATPAAAAVGKPRLVTCTAAGANKVAVPYWLSYLQVIPLVLAQTQGVHVHIGKLGRLYRLRMAWALWRKGIAANRFCYVAQVDSVWRALQLHQVDLYLTSFPYGGAKTMVEVMGAGVPMAVHVHSTRPFLSAIDMAPEGSLFWRSPRELLELLEWLATQGKASLHQMGQQARACYENNHLPAYLQTRVADAQRAAIEARYLQAPVLASSSPLDVAFETTLQMSLLGWLRRKFYFYGRVFRSAFD